MDAAWVGLVAGVSGALVGGSASFFGPLRLERRKEAAAKRAEMENRRREDLSRVIEAQVSCSNWIRFMRRVAAGESRVTATEFEARNEEFSSAAERALAELSYAGLEEGRSELIAMMRDLEKSVWRALSLQRELREAAIEGIPFGATWRHRELLEINWKERLRAREYWYETEDDPPRTPLPPPAAPS
jgi:hypothetical protein